MPRLWHQPPRPLPRRLCCSRHSFQGYHRCYLGLRPLPSRRRHPNPHEVRRFCLLVLRPGRQRPPPYHQDGSVYRLRQNLEDRYQTDLQLLRDLKRSRSQHGLGQSYQRDWYSGCCQERPNDEQRHRHCYCQLRLSGGCQVWRSRIGFMLRFRFTGHLHPRFCIQIDPTLRQNTSSLRDSNILCICFQ